MEDRNKNKMSLTIKNVRLETGFVKNEEGVVGTKTELFSVEINNRKISAIHPNTENVADALDAKGLLMLPAFKDMHVHLDKTLYGLPWQALSPKRKSVADMIAYEQKIIPELLKTSTQRAGLLIDLLQKYGTTFARTHFNLEPTSGFKSLENLQLALENKQSYFNADLVAFPQHGLFYTNSTDLMKEAALLEQVKFIGGLDPYTIDKNIEKVIDFTVQLALDTNKGIDIHLHDLGKEGVKTISYLIEKTLENPTLKGKTFITHAYVLATLPDIELEEIAQKLAYANVGIVSSIPYRNERMPIPKLVNHSVNVLVGTDNIQDYWSTMGSGSMLEKAHLMADLYGWENEFDLSRTLRFATSNVLPLDDKVNKQWPQVDDIANLVFIDASCSAEAVSRISEVKMLFHNGNRVF